MPPTRQNNVSPNNLAGAGRRMAALLRSGGPVALGVLSLTRMASVGALIALEKTVWWPAHVPTRGPGGHHPERRDTGAIHGAYIPLHLAVAVPFCPKLPFCQKASVLPEGFRSARRLPFCQKTVGGTSAPTTRLPKLLPPEEVIIAAPRPMP
jgi:hypothetical protein